METFRTLLYLVSVAYRPHSTIIGEVKIHNFKLESIISGYGSALMLQIWETKEQSWNPGPFQLHLVIKYFYKKCTIYDSDVSRCR